LYMLVIDAGGGHVFKELTEATRLFRMGQPHEHLFELIQLVRGVARRLEESGIDVLQPATAIEQSDPPRDVSKERTQALIPLMRICIRATPGSNVDRTAGEVAD